MVIYCFKLIVLLLSLLGYIFYVHRKGIALCFCPILAISSLSLAMFLAGLLNIMPLAAAGLLAVGLLLLYHTVRNRQLSLSREHLFVGIFFLASYFFFAFRLRDTQVSWYDNFSHWAMVVRDMLKTDHLPNFSSYLIDFQSYPTGISGFIYYICKILDSTEGSMLFAQFLVLLSCLCTLFAFVKRTSHPIFSTAVILMGAAYLLTVCVPITELCVDTLLSLLAIASFAIILYYKDDRPKAWVCTAIIMSFLTLVKTSGMFFAMMHSLLLLLMEIQAAKAQKAPVKLRRLVILLTLTIGIPLFCYYLWNRHVAVSFYAGNMSKHSLSPAYLISIFQSKSSGETQLLIHNFFHRLTYLGGEFTAIVSFLTVFPLGILWKKIGLKKSAGYDLSMFAWCIFCYVCYLVGMLGMYLFAMPYGEAVELASFVRYLLTITSYIIGITLIYLLNAMGTDMDRHHLVKLTAAILVCFLLFVTPVHVGTIFRGNNILTEKNLLSSAKNDYGIADESLCYLTGEGDFSLLYYLARYELWSGNLVFGDGPSKEEYSQFVQDYEFFIVVEETDAAKAFLEAYGLPLNQRVYNLYDLK